MKWRLLYSSSLKLLATPALILHSIIISFRPAWLARDTALASSVHSLQEMTNRVKDNMHPLCTNGCYVPE